MNLFPWAWQRTASQDDSYDVEVIDVGSLRRDGRSRRA
jgi:hypothetical protein